MTRHKKSPAFTIEKLGHDCLDVRELRRKGVLGSPDWTLFRPGLGWPNIVQIRAARFANLLDLPGHHSRNESASHGRPFTSAASDPGCTVPTAENRVARLYNGLGGYFCRACVGNPIYASQALSALARPHFQACELRLRLGGNASLTAPIPERPRRMHRRTYRGLKSCLLKRQTSLSPRLRDKEPDYPSLVAYFL